MVLPEFCKGTIGPSRSYTGQGTAHGLGPRSNHYSLVSPKLSLQMFLENFNHFIHKLK